jgi:hypothetical protein
VLADSMVRIANIAEQAMNPKFFTRWAIDRIS